MKRVLPLLLALLVLLSGFAFAEGEMSPGEEGQTETFTSETDGTNITVNVTVPSSQNEAVVNDPVVIPEAETTSIPVSYATYSLDESGNTEDTASLPALLVELFGEYSPRTQTVTEYLGDGTSVTYQQVIPGVAGMDFGWLASVVLFALMVFCVFKLMGGLLKL